MSPADAGPLLAPSTDRAAPSSLPGAEDPSRHRSFVPRTPAPDGFRPFAGARPVLAAFGPTKKPPSGLPGRETPRRLTSPPIAALGGLRASA
jgi:hypothetical protein